MTVQKLALVAAVLLPLAQPALAADPVVVQEADRTVYRKKTVIDFNDVTLEGELARPEGSYLLNRKRTRFGSLIKLRGDFVPELQRSVEEM